MGKLRKTAPCTRKPAPEVAPTDTAFRRFRRLAEHGVANRLFQNKGIMLNDTQKSRMFEVMDFEK